MDETKDEKDKSIHEHLENIHDEFYKDNRKKYIFGKNKQKNSCNESVVEQYPLAELLQKTCFLVEDGVMLDYTLFKKFVHPGIFEQTFQHVISQFHQSRQTLGGKTTLYVNCDTLTISALDRHKHLIEMFARDDYGILKSLVAIHIYNTPTFMELIKTFIIRYAGRDVMNKVLFYSKNGNDNS